jgi:hypothetical protein
MEDSKEIGDISSLAFYKNHSDCCVVSYLKGS